MKKLLASILLFVSSFALAGQIDKLTQDGCDFLGSVAACVTEENKKKVKSGFCKESIVGIVEGFKAQQPADDFSLADKLIEQEMARVKLTKSKDTQGTFNAVRDRCYAVGGDIKQLLNKEL